MMDSSNDFADYLDELLPKIELLSIDNIPLDGTFIGAAGFEDRGFSFIDRAIDLNKKFTNAIGLEYRPFNKKNRIDEFREKLPKITKARESMLIYDRFNPDKFVADFRNKREIWDSANVIIDISSMSKFLIIVILDLLDNYNGNVHIIYSEAKIYHPTPEEFNAGKEKLPKKIPTFLTKEVHKIITISALSSIEMQGYPLLIIAFPSFNYGELVALLDKMTPQHLIKIEGIPHEEINAWRSDAIHWLNEKIDGSTYFNISKIIHRKVTTFDYRDLVICLDEIFKDYRCTHKFVVAPTGSKLQTFGTFLFKQMHPEVHIVYPVTKEYAEEYSEGLRNIWHISISEFSNFINTLKEHRKYHVVSLGKKINSLPNYLYLLHISDIHLETESEALQYGSSLKTDLFKNLQVKKLDYLAISGDIANLSNQDEYKAAANLLKDIMTNFNLDPNCVIVVPGNHDINWGSSEDAYTNIAKSALPTDTPEENCIPADKDDEILLRDEDKYRQRFENFSEFFYKAIFGDRYPLDYINQGIFYKNEKEKILFLGLNSCWEIDHYKPYQSRASINMNALAMSLNLLMGDEYDDWLKIVVFHHPVIGPEMMKDTGFLQQLADHRFQLCMNGHIHEPNQDLYKHDDRHSIHIIGAGTFGAPKGENTRAPLQYNLLKLDLDNSKIIVESRKKDNPNGSWKADPRWGDTNQNPDWRYCIRFKKF
jgi:predicted MPP superfamily phosphohydrolase